MENSILAQCSPELPAMITFGEGLFSTRTHTQTPIPKERIHLDQRTRIAILFDMFSIGFHCVIDCGADGGGGGGDGDDAATFCVCRKSL